VVVVVGMDDNDAVAVVDGLDADNDMVFDMVVVVARVVPVVADVVVVDNTDTVDVAVECAWGSEAMDDNDVTVVEVVVAGMYDNDMVVVVVVEDVVVVAGICDNVAAVEVVVVDSLDDNDVVVDCLDGATIGSVPDTAVAAAVEADCSDASAANPRPSPPPPTSKSLMPAAVDAAWSCEWRLEAMELLLLDLHQVRLDLLQENISVLLLLRRLGLRLRHVGRRLRHVDTVLLEEVLPSSRRRALSEA